MFSATDALVCLQRAEPATKDRMNERRFERWLIDAIEEHGDHRDDERHRVADVENFVQAGVLTMNRGLVVRFVDGSELQLTIVQSRLGRDDAEEGDEQ